MHAYAQNIVMMLFWGVFVSYPLVFSPIIVHAQVFSGLGSGSINLTTNPRLASPNSSITISLDDYSVNALGATISWFIDGIEKKNLENNRSIIVETGDLGTHKKVTVVLSRENMPQLSHTIAITPSAIDLILESDTYVPSFYKGRSLPSTGSAIRAIAIVHTDTPDPESAFTFKWSLGGEVLDGGSVLGKNSINLTMPIFSKNTLAVQVYDKQGIPIGSKSVRLTAADPELVFYEYSPLRGLNEQALSKSLNLTSGESTVYGEPYYLHVGRTLSDTQFEWRINGRPARSSDATNAITLQQVGGGGSARVDLNVLTTKSIPQALSGVFETLFQ